MIFQAILITSQNFGNVFTTANTTNSTFVVFYSNTSLGFQPSKVIVNEKNKLWRSLEFALFFFTFFSKYQRNVFQCYCMSFKQEFLKCQLYKRDPFRGLSSYVQFEKREKLQSTTLVKVTLLHGCFSRF